MDLPVSETDWKTLNVTVFGGSGFLGKSIIRQLLSRGCASVTSFNRSKLPDSFLKSGVHHFAGSITDADAVSSAVQSADVIFHVAAMTGIWGRPSDFFAVNTVAVEHLLTAAKRAGRCQAFIHTGSPSAMYRGTEDVENFCESEDFVPPDSFLAPYPASKYAAERIVRDAAASAFQTVVVRPHLIYGPDDPHILPRLMMKSRAGRLFQVGKGMNKVDLTYVENAAFGHLCAAETLLDPLRRARANGKGFFISDELPVLLWEWISEFLSRLGLPGIRGRVPYLLAYGLGALCERFFAYDKEPPLTRFSVAQLAHSHWFDPIPARNALGYFPLVDPATAFEQTLQYFKKEIGND